MLPVATSTDPGHGVETGPAYPGVEPGLGMETGPACPGVEPGLGVGKEPREVGWEPQSRRVRRGKNEGVGLGGARGGLCSRGITPDRRLLAAPSHADALCVLRGSAAPSHLPRLGPTSAAVRSAAVRSAAVRSAAVRSAALLLALLALLTTHPATADQLLVVERERGKLALVRDGKLIGEIGTLGDLRHATVKFWRGAGWVISRDGLLSRIDLSTGKVTAQEKVGSSSIGLIFVGDHIAIANYDPKEVVLLDASLKVLRRVPTASRNVGIKAHGQRLVFSLMDKDQIWVLDGANDYRKRVFENVGKLPYDALIAGSTYLVGFFKENSLGVLDVETLSYRKVQLGERGTQFPMKIPHFGMWGVSGRTAFIPASGERRLYLYDLAAMKTTGHLELAGMPVFAITSPDGRWMAVNHSGDKENLLTIVDVRARKVARTFEAGKRVMHMKFSPDGKRLYLSSYYGNRLRIFGTADWQVESELVLPTPSGIFVAPPGGTR